MDTIKISEALSNESLSLKKLSQETKTPYSTLLRAIHAPVAGQAYDPEAINMDAIIAALKAKMTPEAYEAFDFEALIDTEVATALDLSLGAKLTIKRGGGLRKPEAVYTVVYLTATHVVLDDSTNTEPRVVSIKTLKAFGASNIEDTQAE